MANQHSFTDLIAKIDHSYAELIKTAEMLRDAFFIEAKVCLAQGRPHIPIVIHIQKSNRNSTSVCWARMLVKKIDGNTKSKPFPRRIAKGVGRGKKSYSYPATCFQFLGREMKQLVLNYEKSLTVIREQCSRLLQQRRDTIKLMEMEADFQEFYSSRIFLVTLSSPAGSRL